MTVGVPEQRDSEDTLVSYRLGKLEEGMDSLNKKFDAFLEKAQVTLIDHRLKSLETSRNKMAAFITGLSVLVIGKIIDDLFGFGAK